MMEYADVNGRASMSDIIDYYLNYFHLYGLLHSLKYKHNS